MRSFALLTIAAGFVASASVADASGLTFKTLDNPLDTTFNQLLGINNSGEISGYYGSGASGHPNQGYIISAPYKTFSPVKYFQLRGDNPHYAAVQATGLNSAGSISGFYSFDGVTDQAFVYKYAGNFGGQPGYTLVPISDPATPHNTQSSVNQVLGINDGNIAVGFYNDANGNSHGYAYNLNSNTYTQLPIAHSTADAATGINKASTICGFFVDNSGKTHGYIESLNGGLTSSYRVPKSSVTQFLGINSLNITVGFFVDAAGMTHGLLYNPATGNELTIDAPGAVGGTTLNGMNDMGQLVGFYVDKAGNTHGLLVSGAPKTF